MMEHIRNRTGNRQLNRELFAQRYQGGRTGDAFGDAVARSNYFGERSAFAERLAKSSGNRVANLISASQGIFQINQPNSTETASGGMYDTSTIEKKVRAVVTIRYRTE